MAKTFIKRGVQPDDRPFILERRDKIIAFVLGASMLFYVAGLVTILLSLRGTRVLSSKSALGGR